MARRKARGNKSADGQQGGAARKREKAPQIDYESEDGSLLTLRASLTVGARREYADALAGHGASPGAGQEDVWYRASELLFERLATRWVIGGAPIERQRDLLLRYRAASPAERAFVRTALVEHCAEWFPDVKVR